MNSKQLRVMWIGVGVVVAMFLFPPWMYVGNGGFAGYGFLLHHELLGRHRVVYMELLLVQWVLVGIVTAASVVTMKKKP